MIPFDKIIGLAPNNSNSREFGYQAYEEKHKETRNSKFEDCVKKKIYVGVSNWLYRIYSHRRTIFQRRHAERDKHKMPYASTDNNNGAICAEVAGVEVNESRSTLASLVDTHDEDKQDSCGPSQRESDDNDNEEVNPFSFTMPNDRHARE